MKMRPTFVSFRFSLLLALFVAATAVLGQSQYLAVLQSADWNWQTCDGVTYGRAAFSDLYGLDEQMALRIAAGFGGGVGRLRMMCGAVSALVILIGLDCGQTEGSDREGKSACYKVVQQLLAQSEAENGSLICAEILGLKGHEKAHSSYVASPRTAEYYRTRPCAAKVESAARIFANYLKAKQG